MRKIAMLTGAAGGMGRAICAQLLADGFHVIGADINWGDDKMDSHPAFSAETADLADDAAVASLFARIKAAHGGLDVLVNNAGTCFMSDFPDIPAAEFKAQMAINFDSCFYCCQAAVPLMLNRDGVRKIINISSNGAYNFDVFDPPHYRASKAALNQLMRTLSIELARANPNACVATLHPGTVDTDLSKPFQGNVPADKLFTADDAAARLWRVLDGLTPADTGTLFAYDGSIIPY